MSEKKKLRIQLARATKEDFKNLTLAQELLVAVHRFHCIHKDDFSHFTAEDLETIKSIFDEYGEIDHEKLCACVCDLSIGFFRVISGYQVMFDNAYDPDKDTLEFKPWISKSIDVLDQINKSITEGFEGFGKIKEGGFLHTEIQAVLLMQNSDYGNEAQS